MNGSDAGPDSRRAKAFVFAGGGTGGHIYPSLAIIEELKAIDPSCSVHILCSQRAIDRQILEQEAIEFTPIPAMPVSTKPRGFIKFITSWGPSLRATRERIRAYKDQNKDVILVAMGGFVAAPAARGGHCERVPVCLVNLDAVPGKANVLIAKKAQVKISATPIAGFESWERVPPIVRRSMNDGDQAMSAGDARASFGLDPATKTLLITGGSQGAASITGFVRTMVEQRPEAFAGWQVIHQVGRLMSDADLDALRAVYQSAKINAWVERYIDGMGPALAAADLAMGRCGAGTVAECWGARVPAVFFPYPYHKDEHQKHNAQVLVDAGSAMVLTDQIEPSENLAHHGEAFAEILQSDDSRQLMIIGFDDLGAPDGASRIAERLLAIG